MDEEMRLRWMGLLVQGHTALSEPGLEPSPSDIYAYALNRHGPMPSNEFTYHLVYVAD